MRTEEEILGLFDPYINYQPGEQEAPVNNLAFWRLRYLMGSLQVTPNPGLFLPTRPGRHTTLNDVLPKKNSETKGWSK